MYIFSNILGVFVFNERFELLDQVQFESIDDYQSREKSIEKIRHNHKNLREIEEEDLPKVLSFFRKKEFLLEFPEKNLALTKIGVRNSVLDDVLLIHAVKTIDELDKATNLLAKRLREWYGLHNPETSREIENHEKFVEIILEKEKEDLLKEVGMKKEDSMGADLKQEDLEPIRRLMHQIFDLYQLRKETLGYISTIMESLCPNIKAVCDIMVGSKLIEHAGSLRRLSEMPSSTIQVLGAENALFRHMKTGAKPPRHGIIVSHPLIANAPQKMHGKVARALADKISIAAKVDYFKGRFVGNELRKMLEEKFK